MSTKSKAKTIYPKVGEYVKSTSGDKVGVVTNSVKTKGGRTITFTPTMYPKWKFYVEIRKSIEPLTHSEYYAVIKARNNEIVFTGETRKCKSSLIKTINNLFPNVVIKDKTV